MNRVVFSTLLILALATAARPADALRVPPGADDEGDYPFGEVIESTTGFRVVAFDRAETAHRELLGRLQKVARAAAHAARRSGIRKSRANEVGNAMETFVLEVMTAQGLDAVHPKTQSGRTLSTGYPDFDLNSQPACYLELKTHSRHTAGSTQRTFYYSPSADPKITHDGLHLLLAFQMVQTTEEGRSVWRPERFQITSLDQVEVKLKVECNQSNRGLYSGPHTLADEAVE